MAPAPTGHRFGVPTAAPGARAKGPRSQRWGAGPTVPARRRTKQRMLAASARSARRAATADRFRHRCRSRGPTGSAGYPPRRPQRHRARRHQARRWPRRADRLNGRAAPGRCRRRRWRLGGGSGIRRSCRYRPRPPNPSPGGSRRCRRPAAARSPNRRPEPNRPDPRPTATADTAPRAAPPRRSGRRWSSSARSARATPTGRRRPRCQSWRQRRDQLRVRWL